MALINTSVPNLIQGVSQQSETTRFEGQCEVQENAIGSIVEGLTKRPNTRHIQKILTQALDSNSFFHFFNRDEDERYVIISDGTDIRAFNLISGATCTINGGNSVAHTSFPYLDFTKATDLKALTVGDTTFLLNTTVTTSEGTTSSGAASRDSFVYIAQGDYEKLYGVRFEVGSGPYVIQVGIQSEDSNHPKHADSSRIAKNLNASYSLTGTVAETFTRAGNLTSKFTATRYNNLIKYTPVASNTDDYEISTEDGLAGTGIKAVYKKVPSITDLPAKSLNNFEVAVSGDSDTNADDFYVKFETNNGADFGEGSYVETVGPNVVLDLDASTLPHELVLTAKDTFTLREAIYADRSVGDDNSNPMPSFIGNRINDIFIYKNRLGFLSRDKVIMSVGGLGRVDSNGRVNYNFFKSTVQTSLDTDPIDVTVANKRVTDLQAAIGFQENLIMFSNGGQFALRGGNLLTPKTVSITPITNFEYEKRIEPLALGSYLYFPFTRGSFTGVREYTVNPNTDSYDASEITQHIPSYMPNNPRALVGTSNENMIFATYDDELQTIYAYRYAWNGGSKILSAWCKFTFSTDILAMDVIEGTLYLVAVKEDETHLLEMPLQDGLKDSVGFNTYLDFRVKHTVESGDNDSTSITVTLPFKGTGTNEVEAYRASGKEVTASLANGTNSITLNKTAGDSNFLTGDEIWIGLPYTMRYDFSERIFKDNKVATNASKLKIRNGSLFFNDTNTFNVKITVPNRSVANNVFEADNVNSETIGVIEIADGVFRFPVFADSDDAVVSIQDDGVFPIHIQSAEFESFVHPRSSRIA